MKIFMYLLTTIIFWKTQCLKHTSEKMCVSFAELNFYTINFKLTVYLFQDSVLLAESSHFTFVYDGQECCIVVLNAQLEDAGVYTCTAKNLAGEISCKAELTVHAGN